MPEVMFIEEPCEYERKGNNIYIYSHSQDRTVIRAMSIHNALISNARVGQLLDEWFEEQAGKVIALRRP